MVAYTSATSKSPMSGPAPTKLLRLFALYENLTRFVTPLCSAVPGRPNPETSVDQSNNIVDISKVGLKQFWNLRSHMQDASTLATAHYPETLDRIFVNSPPPSWNIEPPRSDLACSLSFKNTVSPFTTTCLHILILSLDHRRPFVLPHGLGLDQKMVRSNHHFENIHPLC